MPRLSSVPVSGAVEGIVDEAVVGRLLREAGAEISVIYGKKGKGDLRRLISGYNHAARFSPWLVLVDLDQDAECAPPLVAEWLPAPAPMMSFRVAVHEVEAWLLGDREGLSAFLRIPASRIPFDVDAVLDPKRLMVRLARRSRRSDIRKDMVPRPTSGRTEGPAYSSRLIEFAAGEWNPDRAAERSDSLRRCRACIADLTARR